MQLRTATGCDLILGKVVMLTQIGWPAKLDDDLTNTGFGEMIKSGCFL